MKNETKIWEKKNKTREDFKKVQDFKRQSDIMMKDMSLACEKNYDFQKSRSCLDFWDGFIVSNLEIAQTRKDMAR